MTMMMSHRQEQLFPELKHMELSPHFKSLRQSMRPQAKRKLDRENNLRRAGIKEVWIYV